eukprot:1518755-Alexandrium_andersonii.AAC.1
MVVVGNGPGACKRRSDSLARNQRRLQTSSALSARPRYPGCANRAGSPDSAQALSTTMAVQTAHPLQQ